MIDALEGRDVSSRPIPVQNAPAAPAKAAKRVAPAKSEKRASTKSEPAAAPPESVSAKHKRAKREQHESDNASEGDFDIVD